MHFLQIADLRDNIGILSEIIKETNNTHHDMEETIATLAKDAPISSVYDNLLKNLNEGIENRKSVFTVSNIWSFNRVGRHFIKLSFYSMTETFY